MNLLKRSHRACILALFGIFTFSSEAQVFWTEDFEVDGEGSTYNTTNFAGGAVFNDGTSDHFGRTDGSNISGGYTSPSNSFFWAGEDLDDNGGDLSPAKEIIFASQSIAGMNMVRFSALVAQGSAGATGLDANDTLYFQYRVDGGPWTTVLQFLGVAAGSNVGWGHDADLTGLGDDGAPLTTTFASFSADFAVSGSSIEIRARAYANSASEEFAFDNLQLEDISGPAGPILVINEILADPDAALGDANGDGSVDTSEDEFVEIVNTGTGAADISGYTLSDAVGVRHTFPPATIIQPNCAVVVFGGGTPTGTFGNTIVQTASSGFLGLNNGGDDVILADDMGTTVVEVLSYGGANGGNNNSVTRDPDLSGGFVEHASASTSGGSLFSPGTFADGTNFSGCTAPTCGISITGASTTCDALTGGIDTYTLSITYTGSEAGVIVQNNSGSGTVGGDDPATTANGTIIVSGINETDDYDVSLTAPCDAISITGSAPACLPLPDLVINEINADPDASLGDANGDGTVSSTQDEFVEIVNNEAVDVDVSGYTLSDAVSVRHTFAAGTIIPAGCAIVVFGGGTPTGAFGGALTTTASGGQLGLNNGGDDVTLATGSGTIVAQVLSYTGAGSNQSITLDPDITGGTFVQHTGATGSGGTLYSPGTRIDGTNFSGCTPPACSVSFLTETVTCETNTAGTTDTYTVSIPYSGVQAGVTIVNNSGSGSISASSDDPAVNNGGTIIIEGISEADAYDISLSAPCDANAVSGPAPTCDPIVLPTLVINEVDYDQPGSDDAEFVEIKNVGAAPVDLTGIELLVINGAGGGSISNTIALNSVSLAAGDYYVVCKDGGTTANCDQVESGMSLQNGAPDGVALRDGSGNLIDVVSYEGDVAAPYTEGSGVGLEDSGASGNELSGISRFPDGEDTDMNNVDFTVRCITPGLANTAQNSFCLCEPPTASVSTTCPDDFNFNIVVDVTSLGSSGTVDIFDSFGGFQTGVGIGMYTFGPYPNNTVVDIFIGHDSEPTCDVVITGITTDCTPAGPCADNEVNLNITTDDFPNEITWEIYTSGFASVVCSGGPYFANFSQFTETCCLPDGAYELLFSDAFGDGINPGGGFELLDPNGEMIIGAEGVVIPGGSALNYGQSFAVPIGTVKLYHYFCGRRDYLMNDFIVSELDPAVTAEFGVGDNTDDGYQFWFFDVYTGYSRRIFRSHANPSPGTAPGPGAAAHVRFSNMTTLPIPMNTLLNCRIRPRVNGVFGAFGPSCFVEVNPSNAACPVTQLVDDTANQFFSCGVTKEFGGSDKIYAEPIAGANRYRFRFQIPSEGFTRFITRNSYALRLRWFTLPLEAGKTYEVHVAASLDNGATYCAFGDMCEVTISGTVPAAGAMERTLTNGLTTVNGTMNIWPNPNTGEQLNLLAEGTGQVNGAATLTIVDLFGKTVSEQVVQLTDGMVNTQVDLPRELAKGMYLVQLEVGSQRIVSRLIIE